MLSVKVGDVARSVSNTHRFPEPEVIFLNTGDVYRGDFLHSNRSPVASLPGQAKKAIEQGDILLSEIRPANGRWALVRRPSPDYVVSTKLMVIRADTSKILAEYLYLFLTAPATAAWLQHLAESRSGTFPQITFSDVARLEVPLPSLEEQTRIAGVLGALDDLIAVNERIRDDAERLGQALLAAFEGSSAAWRLATVGESAQLVEAGRRPKGGVAGITEGVPSVGAESIDGLGRFDFTKTKYVPVDFANSMKQGVVQSRDVLVYKDGGKPGEFRPHVGMFGDGFPYERVTINEHVFRVRAAEPLTQPFLYFWLSSPASLAAMAIAGTGAAIPGMNSSTFKALPVRVPPKEVRDALFPQLDAVVTTALDAAKAARQAQLVRDELLPLLMSGKVSTGEVAA